MVNSTILACTSEREAELDDDDLAELLATEDVSVDKMRLTWTSVGEVDED